MNTLLNDDRDEYLDERETSHGQRDREITLGTMTILGIFFALAVLCAVFFGFGYSTGRRQPNTIAAVPAAPALNTYTSSGSKPSAAATDPIPNPPAANAAPAEPVPAPKPAVPVTRLTTSEADGAIVGVPPAPAPRALPVAAAAPAPVTASPSATGSFMVQVAAVSHQEDADLLITTLKRVHYNVAIHQEPQDKLLHVQIGPFASRADAMAMRQRLQGDGFNAIVK